MNAIYFIDWWKLNVILYNEVDMMSMIEYIWNSSIFNSIHSLNQA